MKALTLWQPYATAIARAAADPRWKRIENRGWPPPPAILGHRIAIHAGAKPPNRAFGMPDGFELELRELPLSCIVATAVVAGALDQRKGGRLHMPEDTPRAVANLADVLARLDRDPWWIGPVGWLLADVVALEQPVLCNGAMKLWTVPPSIEAVVLERTRRAA